jgi:hypothetical protein
MLTSVQGIFRDGKIELLETPPDLKEAKVIVTFLPKQGPVDLRSIGIDEAEAARIRAQFETIREDWERPEMDVYDDA